MKPRKKKSLQNSPKSSVRVNPVKKSVAKRERAKVDKPKNYGWMIVGFDLSVSSLAGAAIAYDGILKRVVGPGFFMQRWSKEDHYYDRLKFVAKAQDAIFALMGELKLGNMPLDKIFIAQEEPFPAHSGFTSRNLGNSLKQQAEMSGAFMGGLLRYGYENVEQIPNSTWRKTVADDIGGGVTTHYTKWPDKKLAKRYNCTIENSGKFRAKQWALTEGISPFNVDEIPDWPDIIESGKYGKIPRPEGSTARAVQPDDRYDALAIMRTEWRRLCEDGTISWGVWA